jgi:hypothetical protein
MFPSEFVHFVVDRHFKILEAEELFDIYCQKQYMVPWFPDIN